MIEFVILMMFWAPDGTLHTQMRRGMPTAEHCEAALRYDLPQFQRQFPSAEGRCIASPARPAGLPEPSPIKPGATT